MYSMHCKHNNYYVFYIEIFASYFVQCNGKGIFWRHIIDLYSRNSVTGLSLVPKLKYEHVYLTSFSKMRVDLAAQVCIVYVGV